MKCIKNNKTGDIQRVTDREAYNMAGNTWSYVSKSEWKLQTRKPKEEIEKKDNPKQMNGVESTEPFVKTRKKSK